MKEQYSTRGAFETYIDYLALRRHFETESYDYHKYNGKVKANLASFKTRNDVFSFYKLSENKNRHNILLANILKKQSIWIGEIQSEEGMQVYRDWLGRTGSLEYNFKLELKKLKDDFKSNFVVDNAQHPYIMEQYSKKNISIETLSILVNMTKISSYWDKEISDTVIAKNINKVCRKYVPFIAYDHTKYKKIVKDTFF